MKKLILFLGLYMALISTYSQDIEISWQRCYGGSEDDVVHDIVHIEDGYFITGGTASYDGDISFNHGHSDFWLIRTDSTGDILWEKTYGGSSGDFCSKILSSHDNSYYLLGNSMSSDGNISYDPYPGSNDIWIVKIDSLGNILWDKIIGGEIIDVIESGISTIDGGVVIFGWTGSQNGDVSINYGMYDMWLVKLNSDGDIEWDKSFGTDDFDFGNTIIQTSDRGFLVGGTSTIGNGGNLTCVPHNINSEAILLKLDSLGNIEWQNCFGGSEHDGIFGLLEIIDGYIILAYTDSNDGDVTGHHGQSDIWIIKVDLWGNIIWQKCYGGSGNEYATNIFPSDNNGYVIFGETDSNDGDVSDNHSSSEFDSDIWMLTISDTGELLYQKCIGGTRSEDLYFGVVKKNDYDYVIAGITEYGPSYDVHCTTHGGFGDEDFWLFELKDCAYYAPATPDTPCGADTACSAGGAGTVYTVAPAQNAWSYTWQLLPETAGTINGDSTAATVNWAENYEGTAVITVRSQNDCGQSEWSEPKYTQVQTCLGTEETPAETTVLRVYPNPAKDYVVFEFDAKSPTEVKIYDAFGREVSCLPVAQKKTVWLTKNMRSGLYYYKTEINGKALSGKVVVRD